MTHTITMTHVEVRNEYEERTRTRTWTTSPDRACAIRCAERWVGRLGKSAVAITVTAYPGGGEAPAVVWQFTRDAAPAASPDRPISGPAVEPFDGKFDAEWFNRTLRLDDQGHVIIGQVAA